MRVPILLTLLMLYTAKVQCAQESPACPRKKTYPGVLALNMGSEVILDCRGDVTVDSVPLLMSTENTVRRETRGDVTSHWKTQKARESPGTTGIHYPETEYFATHAKTSGPVTTTNLPTSSVKEQMGNGEVFQAVTQSTESKSVDRVTEEGRALGVTTEMGLSTDRSTSTEYNEDKDYEEKMEELRVTRSVKRQAQWTWNGQLVRDGVENGGTLRLPALRLNDSGNYSCYRTGKLVSSVKISVGIPPVSPTLSCYKKSHISNIRCEWISRQPINPQPQCYLLLWKGLGKATRVTCSYSTVHSRCWCVLASTVDDKHAFTAQLCVTNAAGSATSSLYSYTPQNIIKPDPPAQVLVRPVTGKPHTLEVSWSTPATWRQSSFYILRYQLRYRPLDSKEYQQVEIAERGLSWLISDVLPHIQYELQIRAKDDFDGQWSDWTSPVYAHTWSAQEYTDVPDINTSLEPFWTYPEGSGESEDDVDMSHDAESGVKWVYVLLVGGVFLLITNIMLTVYFLRHRILSKKNTESTSSPSSCSSPSSLLQGEGEVKGIHLHNVDYFFPPLCES